MQGVCTSFPLKLADDAVWRYHDLAKSRAVDRPPASGELCLWLVTSEFRFASASNVGSWLSVAERRRARLHPHSAIGRRFGVARATLRLVVSQMFDCRPQEVQVEDGPDERIIATDPRGERSVHVDVAYSGIWIVIAVGAASVGVEPYGGCARGCGAYREDARRTQRKRRGCIVARSRAANAGRDTRRRGGRRRGGGRAGVRLGEAGRSRCGEVGALRARSALRSDRSHSE